MNGAPVLREGPSVGLRGVVGTGAAVGPRLGGRVWGCESAGPRDPRIRGLRAGFHSLMLINAWKFC